MSRPKSAWIRMSSSSSSIAWSSRFLVKTDAMPPVSWSDERLSPEASRWNQLCLGAGAVGGSDFRRAGRFGRGGGATAAHRRRTGA